VAEVAGGGLKTIEEEAGFLGVEFAGHDHAHDLHDGDLNGIRVLKNGEIDGTGAALVPGVDADALLVPLLVKETEPVAAQSGRPALGAVDAALPGTRYRHLLAKFVFKSAFRFDRHTNSSDYPEQQHRKPESRFSARHQYLAKTHYSLASIFKTVDLILGIPPLNQYDAGGTDLRELFTNVPDTTPYTFTSIKFDGGANATWLSLTKNIDFSEPDADEIALRRAIQLSEGIPHRKPGKQ
jgi:hypothetical protein